MLISERYLQRTTMDACTICMSWIQLLMMLQLIPVKLGIEYQQMVAPV